MCSSNPKLSAASGLEVVTMFQPGRPLLRWASEAKRRAMCQGASNVVDPGAMRPMCSVTCESAGSGVNGSKDVTEWRRLSVSTGVLCTAIGEGLEQACDVA